MKTLSIFLSLLILAFSQADPPLQPQPPQPEMAPMPNQNPQGQNGQQVGNFFSGRDSRLSQTPRPPSNCKIFRFEDACSNILTGDTNEFEEVPDTYAYINRNFNPREIMSQMAQQMNQHRRDNQQRGDNRQRMNRDDLPERGALLSLQTRELLPGAYSLFWKTFSKDQASECLERNNTLCIFADETPTSFSSAAGGIVPLSGELSVSIPAFEGVAYTPGEVVHGSGLGQTQTDEINLLIIYHGSLVDPQKQFYTRELCPLSLNSRCPTLQVVHCPAPTQEESQQ